MGVTGGAVQRYAGPAIVELGVEPPIRSASLRLATNDRRHIPFRWLAAVVLTGVAGTGLIGITIYAALDGQTNLAQAPELAGATRRGPDSTERAVKGDRLIRSADIVAEKQSFRVPTTMRIGDKQVVRMRGFTHVATTLALAPTGAADDIPEFNPLKLLASDANPPDAQADASPPPALDDAEVTFTTRDLAGADPTQFGDQLSPEEVDAQVSEFGRNATAPGRIPLPPQWLLMRTSRAGVQPSNSLSFTDPGFRAAPFSSIEVRMVPENVTPINRSDPSRETKPTEKLVVFRHGDQLEDILRANGATRDQARSIVGAFGIRRGEAPVADGRRLKFFYARLDDSKPVQIARMSVYADENLETTIALADDGGYVEVTKADNTKTLKPQPAPQDDDDGNGFRLYDSLYETALKQQIPRPVIDNLVRIFANDVDFQRRVAGGDSFDAFYSDGDDSDAHSELLYASITVHNEIFKYYRFQTQDDGVVDYYDENGRSVRKFLMRSPVPNATLTSGFGLRFHPILGYSRPHTGVDWAAPIGTPILAAGSGTVLRAHSESGYGNHVEIQHANGYITTYSHMAGFGRGISDGARVKQGQVVGYLGQTGLATGPHLHYEVIINGRFVDPMTVKLARTREMDGKVLADFRRERERIDGLMASAPNAVASSDDKTVPN